MRASKLSRKPLTIILLGKSGSGKTTHGKFLAKAFGLEYMGSGTLLRQFAAKKGFSSRKLSKIMNKGEWVPTFLVSNLWFRVFEKYHDKGILLDGSPRKILEANIVDEALEWYERGNILVVLADVKRDLAIRRILRGHRDRSDDTMKAIRERLTLFDREVMPVVRHYAKKGLLLKVDTSGSPDEVNKKLFKILSSHFGLRNK
ncbi:hypothetical protein A2833_00230 [Candidatus Azambacteria bacterium RIFCSPHIGHO2_01_FULL_44_55]|uniref:Adenylate kinase n=1 Tax=Candidatus Azambacteria bacterium RIFCSPLOWO2_02_FULL_44_14 TaxID=1797306 RepID=A0A1F5CBH7_9BACT|nr:MAG: hypothetical protein A3A18_02615 [Candidatus Azambacteria bacterium RIFCSPLOWO2_01_FULL_44_84]OGD32755.1 MAG: hypothetical protein A3C78_02030 [Candidatus Azambacteria bacterium RIFCSPHIGHO2_02_FULL_45_18]OGD40209.1 MAG: hypothetical protein A3I30_03000 [Candidatus Azambacteria bacterium RIFCSPLOWO2_02_FULL_44_14]OGD41602.1 MAG: hypothetical protein A2833_00230 [Candidatus Azambacteria bacterium RIFCSPHIGHO2_01_FULL_44_55]OGD51985.1 MAG: hypothetical protein A2608_00895 [Candidatus Azam